MTKREKLARGLCWQSADNFDQLNENTKRLYLREADRLLKIIEECEE